MPGHNGQCSHRAWEKALRIRIVVDADADDLHNPIQVSINVGLVEGENTMGPRERVGREEGNVGF